MATNVYTADYTLAAVKRKALIPSTGRITDTDLLGYVNDALDEYVTPLLLASREGYLHATYDTPLVAGQTDYGFPPRSAAERLVRVLLVDGGGNEYALERVETARRTLGYSGFELVDDTIVLRNAPSGYATLRLVYFCAPNRLVTLAECSKVVALSAATVTVDAAPTTFSTSEPLDFIAGVPGFRWRAQSKTPTGIVGTVLTFALGDIPSTLAVGDYVALAGQTPILQVPATVHPLVERYATCLALEALGDPRLDTAVAALERCEKKTVPTLSPRVPGSARVVVNRYSLSRQGTYSAALGAWWRR